MKPITFEKQTLVMAEDQEEYIPLPVHLNRDNGVVTSCWELTDEEIQKLTETKKLWVQIITFNMPLQPQLLLVDEPELV